MADTRKRKERKAVKRLEREARRYKLSPDYWLGLSQDERQRVRKAIKIAKQWRIEKTLDIQHLNNISHLL
ncbi:hypothetical protein M2F94_03730 [Vibrio vulnificus]|nr:hypothetical protein [Vibrio vulnificus]